MMASEKLQVPVEATGAEEAAQKLGKVSDAIDEMKTSATQADDAVKGLEEEQGKLNQKITETATKLRESNRQQQETANRLQQSSLKTIEFTQKLSGAANAVQSLASQLGASGGTAGLIGSLAGAAAAGAQLGGTFGPGGALVGGIVGASIPALSMLTDAFRAVESDAGRMVRSLNESLRTQAQFLQQIQQADATRQSEGNLETGLGTGQEHRAAVAREQERITRAEAAARAREISIQNGHTHGVEGVQAAQAEIAALREEANAARESLRVRQEQYALMRRNREEERLAAQAIRESDRDKKAREDAEREATRNASAAPAAASQAEQRRRADEQLLEQRMSSAGGTSQLGDRSIVLADGERRSEEATRAREVAAREAAQAAQEREREHNELLSQRRELLQGLLTDYDNVTRRQELEKSGIGEVQSAYHEMFASLLQQSADAPTELARDFESAVLRMRESHERMMDTLSEGTRQAAEEQQKILDGLAQQGAGFAGALGGAFSDAFQLAIQGQADFGKAFEQSMKKILMQYGTQLTIEGVAALFTAIGSSVMNQPNAAVKYVEGFGKIALGVGLGAAGAAIPSGASAQPERPREAAPKASEGGGGNVVINWNSPTVMAGTTQQVGREINATVRAANSRFGRAA